MADNVLEIDINATDNASAVMNKVADKSEALGGSLTDLAKKAVIPVGAAFAGVTAIIGTSIKAFSESQQASVRLGLALKNAGDASATTLKQFEDYSTELQNVTGYSDEALQGAMALFTTYGNIGTKMIPEATKATTDLAAAMGIDLDSAAHAVGLALSSPEEGLGRLSKLLPVFKGQLGDTIKDMAASGDIVGAQKLIFDELNKSVGGAGETMGQTFAGQVEILKGKVSTLQETLGKGLLNELTKSFGGFESLSAAIDSANQFLSGNDEAIKIISQSLIVFAVALGAVLLIIGLITGSVFLLTGVIIALVAVIVFAGVTIATFWDELVLMFAERLSAMRDWAVAIWKQITTSIQLEISKWQVAVFNAGGYVVTQFKAMYDGAANWLGKIVAFFDNIINKAKEVGTTLGKFAGGIIPKFQYGGYVDTTGLAVLHAGEFVMSKDMQSGRSPAPSTVSNNYSQPITINATTGGEPDWDVLSYRLAFNLRNSK